MRRLAVIICSLLIALAAQAQDASPLLPYVTAESGGPEGFVITFSTPPASITLGATSAYAGPADPAKALYDSGDGVWRSYASNTIPVVGEYVAFKGDWRTSSGTYQNMFYGTFKDTPYSCSFSGSFEHAATAADAYNSMFRDCNKVVAIHDNPLPPIIGTPFSSMFAYAFRNMSGVTSLPEGFMNTSGLTGSHASFMFYMVCRGMSGVTALPENFLDTSGLTGAPAVGMFANACNGMSGVTNAYVFTFSSNITFTAANVTTVTDGWRNMSNWKGQVLWGTNVLALAIPIPDADNNAFVGCVNMPNYGVIHGNWK